MVSWWLVLIACIVSLVLLALAVWFVAHYVAENDRSSAWFPKSIAALGLALAMCAVLLVPLDIANRRNPTEMGRFGGGLNTELMWQIILWLMASFVVVIVPFTTFYYEAYNPEKSFGHQVAPALMYTLAFFIIFSTLLIALWFTVGKAEIPYYSYAADPQFLEPDSRSLKYYLDQSTQLFVFQVSLYTYAAGLLITLGWVFFTPFGAVGLVCVPIDSMRDWLRRPKPISIKEYSAEKSVILSRSTRLLETGAQLKKAVASNKTRRSVNAFKVEVYQLEKRFRANEVSYKERGVSPIVVVLWFLFSIFSAIISILWLMHIFIYNTFNLNPFLSAMLKELDKTFSLLGIVAYAIFSFYLLYCTVHGCVKVGMRIFFFQIHPLRKDDTLIHALLFNVGLILLCAITVTQFVSMSFKTYATNTAIDLLNSQVSRLKGLGKVIVGFQWAFVAVAFSAIFWVMLCGKKKKKKSKDSDDDGDL